MRIGQNPARRSIPAYSPQRLAAASLVYIPMLEGYFADVLAVVELHLCSLRQNTPEALDILVLDNGSCAAVQERLVEWQEQGMIDWLMLSRHNLGKTGALNWMFGALPNELVVYSDSDVLFRPGWLEHSLEILAAFPRAGMITAQPDFLPLVDGTMQAHLSLDPREYEIGQMIPSQRAVDEYVHGLGEKTRERVEGKPIPGVVHIASGCQAVIGATHMQFIAPREVLQGALPLPATLGLSPEEDQVLDRRVDERGFLHLSTLEPYVYHMGNQVDEIAAQAGIANPGVPFGTTGRAAGSASATRRGAASSNLTQWPVGWRILARLARGAMLRGFFIKLYNRLFQIYSQ